MDLWLVTGILIIAMLLLITEKLPVDLTSIGIIVVLTVTGILTPVATFDKGNASGNIQHP